MVKKKPVKPEKPLRDDDPIHPNFGGLSFRATTDKRGIIATPEYGQTAPPISYMTIPEANELATDLAAIAERLEQADGKSYAAQFFGDVLDELKEAIDACDP